MTNMSRRFRYYRTAVNRRRLPFVDVGSHARFDIELYPFPDDIGASIVHSRMVQNLG